MYLQLMRVTLNVDGNSDTIYTIGKAPSKNPENNQKTTVPSSKNNTLHIPTDGQRYYSSKEENRRANM